MKVKLFGPLRRYAGDRASIEMRIDSEKRVIDIIRSLKIPENQVVVVERGGRAIEKDSTVSNADEITLLPLMEGG